MSAKDNGGYAYPQTPAIGPAGDVHHPSEHGWGGGMTLRDYFAAHAPWARSSFLADPEDGAIERVAALMAKKAYAFADAMLAERSK